MIKGYWKSKYRKRLGVSTAAAVLLLFFFALTGTLSGCATFPTPDEEESSLLIILVDSADGEKVELRFDGPKSFSLKPDRGGRKRARYFRVEPGTYRYKNPADGTARELEIPPDTVFLLQRKLTITTEEADTERPRSFTLTPIDPKDRRWVSGEVESYINFYDWYGKRFAGFGPYVPRFTLDEARYEVEIITEPSGAEVIIDDREWGETPITVQLEPGKHLLRLEEESPSRRAT